MKLGAHVSAAGGLHHIFSRGEEIGCECLQLFTRPPSRWNAAALKPEQIELFRQARASRGGLSVIAHDIYLNNLASEKNDIRQRSIDTMIEELGRCHLLGVDGLVCHIGSHPEGPSKGVPRYSESIALILEKTQDYDTAILLETCAGQGACLGHRLEHLAEIIEGNQGHPKLGVCVDTCHLFAAGYDLREPDLYEAFWKDFDSTIGLTRLKAFHLNDSKKPLSSRVDRHEHIGLGEIGEGTFRLLLSDPRFSGLPAVIETPESEKMAQANLDKLKALRDQSLSISLP